MRGNILSNCEKNFILKAASEFKRLDGRKLEVFRNVRVHFGRDWGLCYVSLGQTKVMTQVKCEIQVPKTTRPNEGLLFVNVELSSMAAPQFESGRTSDLSLHINRLLEKCIKDSRAVDLESLCIVAEEKVWALRVNVIILNHDGNLVDCATISALAALAHFKRPDVTTNGEEIKIHSYSEKDPIGITLHHYPVCVTFALINDSDNMFADPTAVEEKVSDASLTFGINAYQEICCLHLGGTALIRPQIILECCIKAANRAKTVIEIIKKALAKDNQERLQGKTIGFVHNFEWDKITTLSEDRLQIQLSKFDLKKESHNELMKISQLNLENSANFEVNNLGDNCAELIMRDYNEQSNVPMDEKFEVVVEIPPNRIQNMENTLILPEASLGEAGPTKWDMDFSTPVSVGNTYADLDTDDEIQEVPVNPKLVPSIELSGDSEEEDEVVIVNVLDPSSSQNKVIKSSKNKSFKTASLQNDSQVNNSRKNKRKRNRARNTNRNNKN